MTSVGMVDLSTSHPAIFAPLLAELGMPVRAVLDPDRAAELFPDTVAVGSLVELAAACDVVMLLGADWDERTGQLDVLAEQGIPIFVDKPMAGTAGELRALARLADGPCRIDGGSALRVAPEAVRLRESHPAVVDVTCAGHPFYYGVHAVALATAVLGPGLVSARGVSGDLERSIEGVLEHVTGVEISVTVAVSDTAGGFVATVDGQRIEPAADAFYPALLRDTMTRLTTGADLRPGAELVECELALLAIAWSLTKGGAPVALDAVPDAFHPWHGRTPHR